MKGSSTTVGERWRSASALPLGLAAPRGGPGLPQPSDQADRRLPPGGGVDTLARLLGRRCRGPGQPIVTRTGPAPRARSGPPRPRAASPGYTLVMPGRASLDGATHRSPPFDTLSSFKWISTVVTLHFSRWCAPRRIVDGRTVAAARPRRRRSPSPAPEPDRPITHGRDARHRRRCEVLHVPYQGDAPALGALIADDVQFMLATRPRRRQHPGGKTARAGRYRQQQDAGAARGTHHGGSDGIQDFDVRTWSGSPPRQVPAAIVGGLNDEPRKAVVVPESAPASSRSWRGEARTPQGFRAASHAAPDVDYGGRRHRTPQETR